ncbi:CynX/NimT family MFS transporter [Lysobacter enzymogenes]|uniref:MFS transporter n=1 Tax=Lysobacter enzymogenes TaxID=69 RepID=A0A3N2RLZ8_LYSEN|nr:MFS transporter [Lysobacter enzymogenes]ROU08487.1 MFS transporter [Lysobacter enzymogenes]
MKSTSLPFSAQPPSDAAPDHPARADAASTDWRAVAAVFGAGLIAALQVGKTAIALPALRADLGLDLRAGGWLMAVFGLLGLFASVPAGALVARLGDRRLQVAGLAAMALGSALGSQADSLAALMATRVLEGAGFLLFAVAGASVLQRLSRARDRAVVFAIWSCYMPAGMALALATGAALDGWRGYWELNALLCAAAALALHRAVRAPSAQAARPWRAIAADARAVAGARGPLLLALAFALYALQFYALLSFLPTLLMQRMQVDTAGAGVLSGAAIGANVLGNLAAGALLRRGARRWRLIALASATMGLSAAAVFALPLPATVAYGLCVSFALAGGLLPASAIGGAAELERDPGRIAIAVGLLMQGSYLGQVIGPSLFGSVVQAAGWPAAAWPVGLAALGAVAAAVALRGSFAVEGGRG